MDITAEEIHIVVDHDSRDAAPLIDMDPGRYNRKHHSYERRKIKTACSFQVYTPLRQLMYRKTENGSKVVDVDEVPLHTKYFPPMTFSQGIGYHETNVAEVLFGLDPGIENPWVTPVAVAHIESVQKEVLDAGGMFMADFDTSVCGWAKFRSVHVSPKPSKTVYVQAYKIEPTYECCTKQSRVVPPLHLSGGILFKDGFAPSVSELDDPVIFKPLDLRTP